MNPWNPGGILLFHWVDFMDGVNHPSEVQYYSSREHELAHSQVHKARKIMENHCIEYDKEAKAFLCHPIAGYNVTVYRLVHDREAALGFACDCQGFQTKARQVGKFAAQCSHVLALHYWFNERNKARGFGKFKEAGKE